MSEVCILPYSASVSTWVYLMQRIEELYPYAHIDVMPETGQYLKVFLDRPWEEKDGKFFDVLVNTNLISDWRRTKE